MQEPSDIERLWASRRLPESESGPTDGATDGSAPSAREGDAAPTNDAAPRGPRTIRPDDPDFSSKSILAGFSLGPLGNAYGNSSNFTTPGSLRPTGSSSSPINPPHPSLMPSLMGSTVDRRPLPSQPPAEPRAIRPTAATPASGESDMGTPEVSSSTGGSLGEEDDRNFVEDVIQARHRSELSPPEPDSSANNFDSEPPAGKPLEVMDVAGPATPPPTMLPVATLSHGRPMDEEFLDPAEDEMAETPARPSSMIARFFGDESQRPWYLKRKTLAIAGGFMAILFVMQLAGGSSGTSDSTTPTELAGAEGETPNATEPNADGPAPDAPMAKPTDEPAFARSTTPAEEMPSFPSLAPESDPPRQLPPTQHIPAPLPSRLVEQSPDLGPSRAEPQNVSPRLVTVTPSARPPGPRRVAFSGPKPQSLQAAANISILEVPSLVATGRTLAVIAHVTDEFGKPLSDQPVEWSIDRQGAGEIVAVVGKLPDIQPGEKSSSLFARGFTAKQTCDIDGLPGIRLQPGDACCLVCSHSPGDMVVTATAETIPATPQRQAMTKIHWDDARLVLPPPAIASAGSTIRLPIRVANGQGALLSGYRVVIHNENPEVTIDTPSAGQELITDARGEVTLPLRTVSTRPSQAKVHISLYGNQSFPGKPAKLDEGEVEVRWIDPGFNLQVRHEETVPIRTWSRVDVLLEGTKEVALQPGTLVVLPSRELEIRSELELGPLPGEKGLLLREIAGDSPVRCSFDVESLAPGERQLRFEVRQGNRTVFSKLAKINFSQSSLIVTKQFPVENYVGQPIAYRIIVENKGPFPAAGVVLKDELPAEVSILRSTGTRFRDHLMWNVGMIPPGQKVAVDVVASSRSALEKQALRTWVSAENMDEHAIHRELAVRGLASLSISLRDQIDPISPGGETYYRIDLENRGTEPAENVALVVESPAELQFSEVDGSLKGTTAGGKLKLNPVVRLLPGEKLTCVARAKGTREGEARLRIRLEHPSVGPRGIETQESTIIRPSPSSRSAN